MSLSSEIAKKNIINAGEGNSISIHAHFDLIDGPHPFRENLPYGAEMKNSRMKTRIAKLKISISEILYGIAIYESYRRLH